MEIEQKHNETLAAYIHCFNAAAKECAFDNDNAAMCILLKALGIHPIPHPKYMKRTPKLWPRSSGLLRGPVQHTTS